MLRGGRPEPEHTMAEACPVSTDRRCGATVWPTVGLWLKRGSLYCQHVDKAATKPHEHKIKIFWVETAFFRFPIFEAVIAEREVYVFSFFLRFCFFVIHEVRGDQSETST